MTSDLKFYWELVKKRLPVMSVIVTLCMGVGIGLAMTMPPRYEASAALVVEGAALPDTLFTSTVQSEAVNELQQIELRLMSRANLIDIASKHGVFSGAPDMSPDDIVDVMRAATEFTLQPGNRDSATILFVTFSNGDPQITANVVNEYVSYILSADAERRRDGSGQTLEFFENRVESLGRRLTEQNDAIVEFKEANSDALPENLGFRLDRQAQLQQRLSQISRERFLLLEQQNRLIEAGSQAGLLSGQLTAQEQEIARLQTELRSKLVIHEPDSPTIQFLQRQIEVQLAERVPGQEDNEDGPKSLLDIQLAGIESELRSIDMDIQAMEEEMDELEVAIQRTPQIAGRLEELDREYQNTQRQYNDAVLARSTAEQGVDVETSAKGERVALVEQAVVPESPTSPNRKLIAGGGVFVGSALAAMFFVLTELINNAIRRPVDLTRGLGVQPLATIPFIEEASVRRRRRIAKIAFILFVMVSIPVGLWALHTYYLPLDLLLEQVLEKIGV
ncbi:MAG: hypothetical protein AAF222_11480 [Pseudomonadota bacterium]